MPVDIDEWRNLKREQRKVIFESEEYENNPQIKELALLTEIVITKF